MERRFAVLWSNLAVVLGAIQRDFVRCLVVGASTECAGSLSEI